MTSSIKSIDQLSIRRIDHLSVMRDDHRIPFYRYLRLDDVTESPSSATVFYAFIQLPVEIKLMILDQCNYQTWFHLLHTNAELRAIAQSLLWADKAVWYHLDARFVSAVVKGTNSLYDFMCPDFSRQIQQIEIEALEWSLVSSLTTLSAHDTEEVRIQSSDYWQVISKMYPSLRRIVINDSGRAWQVNQDHFDSLYTSFAIAAPSEIEVLLLRCDIVHTARLHRTGRSKHSCAKYRNLYRLAANGQWTLLHCKWQRHLVVPPMKRVDGIVGEVLYHTRYTEECYANLITLSDLRYEVYEEYLFGGTEPTSFACPAPGCEEVFRKAGDYKAHKAGRLLEHMGQSSEFFVKDPDFPSPLPDDLERRLAAEELEHKTAYVEAQKASFRFFDSWGSKESKERMQLTTRFVQQMQSQSMMKNDIVQEQDLGNWQALEAKLAKHWLWRLLRTNMPDYHVYE